ncbi:response regulator transcription factor [Marinicella sediminis]|uniref:Response regulator transcription factor n=1 Tax=Marinicella sediminis TaxID=1792834 RepID=A0ABV7JC39_9GAMM|nr:response regulator transcription factor [Marinicella sediminis]
MKIIIADDHDLVREALATLIVRDDAQAEVIQAESLAPVMHHMAEHDDIDLLLLDVFMPGMEDIAVLKSLKAQYPDTPIVMMSGSIDKPIINACYEHGASGFIPKTMNGNALVSVLKMVLNGVKYVPDMMLQEEQRTSSELNNELTSREHQVLALLLEGQSNKAIANQLFIEPTTVKMHLRSLFKKCDVKNRTELVIKTMKTKA